MKLDLQSISHAFSSGITARSLRLFDRAMIVVVLACWGATIIVMAFALYTVSLSVKAKRDALTAAATEPGLPKMVSKPLESIDLKPLVERLQKNFPDIKIDMSRDRSVTVSATDVGNFRLWLTVLSYIDTVTPQYRWTIKELCVGGRCDRSTPMKAVLGAEKITFVTPALEK